MTFKVKLTERKLKELIKDEEKASKEYESYGLKNIAKDEKKHAKLLKEKLEVEELSNPLGDFGGMWVFGKEKF